MKYLDFCKALGLEPEEEVQKVYEEAELLQPLDTRWIRPLMPQTGARLLRLAEEISADPLKLRYVNLLKECYWTVPEKQIPLLPQGPGKEFENLAPMLVLLSFVDGAEAEMERRGIPEEYRTWSREGYEKTLLTREKILGYPVLTPTYFFWRRRYLIPNLYLIGSLEFELTTLRGETTVYQEKATGKLAGFREDNETEEAYRCTRLLRGGQEGETVILSKEAYSRYLSPGEEVLSVHIPNGTRIDPEAVKNAFAEAREFVARYYPERKPKCFYCGSWLMDPALAEVLKPASNIVTFQRLFSRWCVKSSGREVFSFVHPKPFERYEELPENTSLERMLKQRYLADDPVYVHAGLCPFQ